MAFVVAIAAAALPAAAQINALNAAEKANVQLVIDNLNALVADGRAALPAHPTNQEEQRSEERCGTKTLQGVAT